MNTPTADNAADIEYDALIEDALSEDWAVAAQAQMRLNRPDMLRALFAERIAAEHRDDA